MDINRCFEGFFQWAMSDEWYSWRNAVSELDHQLKDLPKEQRLKLFEHDFFKGYNIDKKYKVYLAGLAEFIYNLYQENPPLWVNESDYFFEANTFIDDISEQLKEFYVQKALPEFKRRNYMVRDVLSAV